MTTKLIIIAIICLILGLITGIIIDKINKF